MGSNPTWPNRIEEMSHMILGTDKLIELIKRKNLIEGLEGDINIEGCGIDLHIEEIWEIAEGKGFLHKDKRKTPNYKLVGKYEKGKSIKIKLLPRKFYIATTLEKINVPENLFGIFIPRGTFYASGILVLGLRVDPGYNGKFRFHLYNLTDREFEIELGARVANMIFLEVKGKTNPYKGQWQGGRVFIKEVEEQTKEDLLNSSN